MLLEGEGGKSAFWINENYTEEASRGTRLVKFFGLLISFLLFFSFIIYSFIWLLIRLFLKRKKPILNHIILFGAGLSFVIMFGAFANAMNDLPTAGELNVNSIIFYISSLALCICSLLSVFRWPKLPKKKGFRVYYVLASISAITISVYLWDIGFVGLKLWSY